MCSCKDNCQSLSTLSTFVTDLRDFAYEESQEDNTEDRKLLRLGEVSGLNKVLRTLKALHDKESIGLLTASCK